MGEHDAEADYRLNAQCMTETGCTVLAVCAFTTNPYYTWQELYKTKFNFKSVKWALCLQELSA